MAIILRNEKQDKLTHQELDNNFIELDDRLQAIEAVPTLRIGYADYGDNATATTPISIPGTSTSVYVTNDTLGAYTDKTHLPSGVSDVWDSTNNQFDWSDLQIGDMLDIRVDLLVTTTAANQYVELDLEMASGDAGSYDLLFFEGSFKTAGTHHINRYNGIYMGNTLTMNNPAKFKIKSDASATLVVNGWYCKVITNRTE